ncbi:MAG: replication restart helicase PriA [Nannocystaceae bacterium]
MSGATRLVSVAVPVNLDQGFTYRVPASVAMPGPGQRVVVPIGSRWVVGVVRPVEPEAIEAKRLRDVLDVLDPADQPALALSLTKLCEWIQQYYAAPVGEVYRLALPGLLCGQDVRQLSLTDDGRAAVRTHTEGTLLPPNLAVIDARGWRVLHELATIAKAKRTVAHLRGLKPRLAKLDPLLLELAQAQLLEIGWPDTDDEKTRVEIHVRRTDYLRSASSDEVTIRKIVGRSKQRRALLDLLDAQPRDTWVSLSELRGPFPRVANLIKPLIAGGLVHSESRPRALDPFASQSLAPTTPQTATADQQGALDPLIQDVDAETFSTTLLHGITGSGKTEVYLQLIAHVLSRGEGAIVLVPEIALTPQLSDRFRARFGERVAVLHSALTPRQRLDAWQQIRRSNIQIVIGARSAVFAPVAKLRAIIVDEEHDGSFKQEDGVRYHARDVALVRARDLGAVVVLGSATPSLESYSKARHEHYKWARLTTRPTPRPLPTVELVSLALHRPDPETLLTSRMVEALNETVAAGEQAIVFLNRRGFATTLLCDGCGALHQCPDCSAPSMTYHLQRNRLMCHLCGYIEAPPAVCQSCGKGELQHGRAGTERVELALETAVVGARVLRLDRDTSRGRRLLTTLNQFRRGEANILVGTQMLSKGHDFPGVTMVGIVQADHGLGLPDLRAAERTFQLLSQVAGRAGRGERGAAGRAPRRPFFQPCAAGQWLGGCRRRRLQRRAAQLEGVGGARR